MDKELLFSDKSKHYHGYQMMGSEMDPELDPQNFPDSLGDGYKARVRLFFDPYLYFTANLFEDRLVVIFDQTSQAYQHYLRYQPWYRKFELTVRQFGAASFEEVGFAFVSELGMLEPNRTRN